MGCVSTPSGQRSQDPSKGLEDLGLETYDWKIRSIYFFNHIRLTNNHPSYRKGLSQSKLV